MITNAPATRDQVVAVVSAIGLNAPTDLIALYSVSDGTRHAPSATIGEISVMPGYYWLPIMEAVEIYKAINVSDEWKPAWFPVLASGGGDFYAVICDPTSPDDGAVVGFMLGEPDHIVEFESLTALFATVAASYQAGAFLVEDGYLVADFPRMRALARELQPNFREHDA